MGNPSLVPPPSKMEHQYQNLRLELKEWEKSFAAGNGGRKAGREDIKQHPDIGEAVGAEQNVASTKELSPKKRRARKPPPTSAQTPQKRLRHLQSPQDVATHPDQAPDSPPDTPVAHRKSIGPTPQKNGRVLGLFDLLTPSSSFRTPSKRQSLAPLPSNVVVTPSRLRPQGEDDSQAKPTSSIAQRSRSPPSASKRMYLASFLTPSARRIADSSNTPEAPSSVSKLRFDDTPAFLRRASQRFSQGSNLNAINDEGREKAFSWSPVAGRTIRPKPAGRGLSALVKGLREREEAKLDEELDILREMEDGNVDAPESQTKSGPTLCVEDSQAPDMPLGPDGQGDSESDDQERLNAEGKDRNGRPLKVWKKKGQKRTTRRVMIRPNTAKWKPEPEWKGGQEDENKEEVATIEETQFATTVKAREPDADAAELHTDDDYVSEGVSDENELQDLTKPNEAKKRGKLKEAQNDQPKGKKKRMISATAHANFRSLKIKNKNSKAKGRGRFGRRR
ncbi:MAG: hypothetical protein LQ348_000030 [Seirophora lacunosa]|nr:MAG: hypothetical protein LQ348_000030 [Seirophora lacunosa]